VLELCLVCKLFLLINPFLAELDTRGQVEKQKEFDMSSDGNTDYQELETLTKAVEIVLRKLIGFLVGKISLVKLQEMVRFIYVEKAENQLKKESPSANVALTKLALLTGLDTRTLTRTRNHVSYRLPFHEKSAFLREATPAVAILDTWASHSEFLDATTGTPKILSVTGKRDSFERLFLLTMKSRGITQQSLLNRLVANEAVILDKKNQTVELVKHSYFPTKSKEQLGAFEVGYSAVANLIDTIVHNFESESIDGRFFQRGVWTLRLSPQRRAELKAALSKILEKAEADGRRVLLDIEENSERPDQMSAGISLFYFEDNAP